MSHKMSGTRNIATTLLMLMLFPAAACSTDANDVETHQNQTTKNPNIIEKKSFQEGTQGVAINKKGSSRFHIRDVERLNCHLYPSDEFLYDKLKQILKVQVKLIELDLQFENSVTSPLKGDATDWLYHPNIWARIGHSHGQTILSLAFNYGILSLMTLSFGVAKFPVSLYEEPVNCLSSLSEENKVKVVLDIMLRDFKRHGEIVVLEGQSVCHQLIVDDNNQARFMDQCCYKNQTSDNIVCTTEDPNTYLQLLSTLMVLVYFMLLLTGPMVVTSMLEGDILDTVDYVIKLKEPLYKTIAVTNNLADEKSRIIASHCINLKPKKDFRRCREVLKVLPRDKIFPIKISEFNIRVNYMKLLTENKVPVGVMQSLFRAVFLCRLEEVGAFQDCCESSVYGYHGKKKARPWISLCRIVGRILFVFFLPLPYYVRLIIYYMFEHEEIIIRRAATDAVGLPPYFDYKILQYLTPIHPMFIGIYFTYFTTGIWLAYRSCFPEKSDFQTVITDAFSDLADQSWLTAANMLIRNIVWPFRKFGVLGFLVGLIYWPIVIPLTVFTCVFYCVPLAYLICRIIAHAIGVATPNALDTDLKLPGEISQPAHMFETDKLLEKLSEQSRTKNKLQKLYTQYCTKKVFLNILKSIICIATLLSVLIMFAECVSFVLQVCLFTMMGLIVNAGKVLKYGTLIFLVVIYSYDTYNNVYVKYLKLNKSLFSEVKNRVRHDLNEVTSLPSHLQANTGFKAAEASEQGEHELTDDINKDNTQQWIINDLILFVDNDDTPRMPKKLFEEVCEIRVAGSPGPVARSLMEATGRFLIIVMFLVFVFIVVLSFGDVYNLSSTNQMLATMAGGFLPFIFSSLLKPAAPDLELNSVSFRSKLEEILINFWQTWPMYDLPFDIEEKQDDASSNGSSQESLASAAHTVATDSVDHMFDAGKPMTVEDKVEMLQAEGLRDAFNECVDIMFIPPSEDGGPDDENEMQMVNMNGDNHHMQNGGVFGIHVV